MIGKEVNFIKNRGAGNCLRLLVLVVFFFFSAPAFSIVNNFNHLTIRDGLSQSTVTSLFQDKAGFLWIGTNDGLNRYDGYSFTTYKPSRTKANSLSSPHITAITEDHLGNLWVGTLEGITIFNPNKDEFRNITADKKLLKDDNQYVNVFFRDFENCVWAGGRNGIRKFQYSSSESSADSLVQISLSQIENPILHKKIVGIGTHNDETIWILTTDSLGMVNSKGESVQLPLELGFPDDAKNASCLFWADNSIYLGAGNGLFYFNLDNPSAGWTEKLCEGNSIEKVSVIKQDLDENIWIGTKQEGVFVYNFDSDNISNYKHNIILERSLNNNTINSMLVTQSGLVAVGTDFGINLYDKKQGLFNVLAISPNAKSPIENIHGLFEDNNGNIWIGTRGGGIFVFSAKGKLVMNLKRNQPFNNAFTNNIRCIIQDQDGIFWIGTESQGVYKIEFQGQRYSQPKLWHYKYSSENRFGIQSNKVYTIFEDTNGELWFGTENGLSCLLPSEKNKNPKNCRFITMQNNPDNDSGLPGNSVYSIYRDRLGTLWVGTLNGGLGKMNDSSFLEKTGLSDQTLAVFTNYKKDRNDLTSLAGGKVFSIYEDKLLGNLWIGTNEGLCRFNRQENNFKVFTTENGLVNNTVYGILEDEAGCLWLSTNHGLSKYDQKNDVFYNYSEGSGLQYPEFNGNAHLKTKKGAFLFGGAKGINSFYPEQIRPSLYKAPVFITGLKIKNQEITTNDETHIFKEPIHKTRKIELKHDQNFITFTFALLNYLNPEQNRFAYKLKGYQNDWIYTTGDNSATFTGVPPGTYTFLLKGSDGYSLWDTEIKRMTVVIKPLIWFTWWAKIIYALLLGGIVYLFLNNYKKREKLKHDINIQRMFFKKNQEIYEEKLDFFTNVSHEFLTPLSLIIGPMHDLILEQKDPAISKRMKLINRSAVRLKNLIDQLLSLRKLDSGQTSIHVVKDDIGRYTRKVASGFNGLAARRNIRYEFEENDVPKDVWFDKDAVEKILYNLLSNAFKHTSEKGEIVVNLSVAPGYQVAKLFADAQLETEICENYATIEVKDNGTGISKDDLLKIFDRYFQVDKRIEGAGVGLSFAQSLAHLHNGIIAVKSKPGKGSSFVFYLPIGDCYEKSQKTESSENAVEPMQSFENLSLPREALATGLKDSATVLVVEDNEEMRYYIADALQYEFNILTAGDGKEAFAAIESGKVDLVISDIVMPVMDGLELVQAIRKSDEYAKIPIILLSARIDSIQQTQGLELGIGAYVSKPFEIPYVVAVAKRLLEQTSALKKPADNLPLNINVSTEVESHDNKLLLQLKKSIEEKYADQNFNVVTLAEDIGLSRSQLHRRFKALTGTTPSNFVKEIRMKEAVRLLENSDLAISEICFAVGFSDPKYFSKEFRKKFGMTPSKYAEPFKK